MTAADRQFDTALRAGDDTGAQRVYKVDVTPAGAAAARTVVLTEVHVTPIPPELRVGTDRWTTTCLWHNIAVDSHDQPAAHTAAAAPYEWCTPCDDALGVILGDQQRDGPR